MNQIEHLQPVVLVNQAGPALWRLAEGTLALALFSDTARAAAYAEALAEPDPQPREPARDESAVDEPAVDEPAATDDSPGEAWQVKSPDPLQMTRMLAACVRAGVQVAALNPHAGEAQRLFDLAEILRDVRGRLQRGEPLRF